MAKPFVFKRNIYYYLCFLTTNIEHKIYCKLKTQIYVISYNIFKN